LSIELRETYRENRGKIGEPSIKTEILEGKQRNQAIKQRKTEETKEKRQKQRNQRKQSKTEKTQFASRIEVRSRCCGT